jgi:adenine deaminase
VIPRDHYQLDVGMLQEGDSADFVVLDNLEDFNVMETFINGVKVAENGKSIWTPEKIWNSNNVPNKFNTNKLQLSDIIVNPQEGKLKVIGALDGELVTNTMFVEPKIKNNNVVSDTNKDVLKMIVYNRYEPTKPKVAFIHNFGFVRGAIASTVAHDSHNIIAVGVDDKDIIKAVNLIVDSKGGIALVDGEKKHHLALPVAGLMSPDNGYEVATAYEIIDNASKKLGSQLNAPFMTLSFMALLVIPELKLSDKGLFDGKKFAFTSLFETAESE